MGLLFKLEVIKVDLPAMHMVLPFQMSNLLDYFPLGVANQGHEVFLGSQAPLNTE